MMEYFPSESNFIDIHSHNAVQEENVFRISNVFSSDYPLLPLDKPISIGLHPWHLSLEAIHALPHILEKTASQDNLLAIGETGLDRIITNPLEEQIEAFRIHIEWSIRLKKPLIIHCVKAFPELLNLRKEYKDATPWILHGFNSNQAIAKDCVNAGIYISLSQRLFRNPAKTEKIISVLPLSMVFAETDDSPAEIGHVYHTIAQYYGIEIAEVKKVLFENFKRIF